MKYKLHYEPMYANECKALLGHIIGGTSIKDEMEDSIAKRGESIRSAIAPHYERPLQIEKYAKENLCFNLPGYEKSGVEMAEFLFKKWESADASPIEAIYSYDLLLSAGIDNKAVMIMYIIGIEFMSQVWGIADIESGNPPPQVEDNKFFGLINNSQLDQEDKLKALKLYYDFDEYRAYAHALLQHTEELLKGMVQENTEDIERHMNFVEINLLSNNAANLKIKSRISLNDDTLYHVYPGIYQANNLTINVSGLFPPYILVGMSWANLDNVYSKAESDKDKAAQFIKCLSDNTKQTILQLLKKEALYGSQLAEKLDCTAANISQHMTSLMKLDVVSIVKESNRVYFHINKDAIHKHLDAAKELFS